MAEKEGEILQFVPFVSRLETGFWHELGRRKLEKYKLSEEQQDIRGCYYNSTVPGLPMHMTLEYSAFDASGSHSYGFPAPGSLLNTNTIDSFKGADKKQLLQGVATKIWEAIESGAAINDPALLSRFFLLTFADLKKFNYYFWFVFPALYPEKPITYKTITTLDKAGWSKEKLSSLESAFDSFHRDNPGVGYFLIHEEGEEQGGVVISLHPLKEFSTIHAMKGKVSLGFADPSTLDSNPGWPLRNFLMLAAQQWGESLGGNVDVLCYRDYTREGKRVNTHSLIIQGVQLPAKTKGLPKCIGWERNEKNKLMPKVVNLSSSMDPVRLAESSVDLNLKLMRWRLLPSLDLETISQTSCLLLGSGTLGCNVARCLLGWGVRHITMLDNSTVSYSNPVRQSLFQFKDCVDGGRHKAVAAAESLKLIFPGVQAEAVDLSIPMPGHSVGTTDKAIEKARKEVETLEKLVKDHDVIFLLMDTRESRWLPTLLCCAHSKICINAALGFDTYMVMRHGFRPPSDATNVPASAASTLSTRIPGNDLGCYFCSDVVAPTDSTRDRTLDQQCTVSRPGVSMMAGALAVELLMSVLQHPDRGLAISENVSEDEDPESESVLGIVPHQIRGFLSRFHNVLPASQRFDKCTACSDTVLHHYKEEGFDFLLKSFNSPNYLEDLTGLSQLYAQTFDDQVWDLSDGEFDD